MALDNEVKVKIVIDNDEANARIGRTDSMLRGLQGSARVGGGGAAGGAGLGGRGAGLGGFGLGLGTVLGGAAALGLGAAAFGPLFQDASTVTQGALGWLGRGASSMLGLQGMAGGMRAVDRAADAVTQALGPSRGVSDATINNLLESYKKVYGPMEDNRNRVENIAGVKKAEIVLDRLSTAIDNLVGALGKIGGSRG